MTMPRRATDRGTVEDHRPWKDTSLRPVRRDRYGEPVEPDDCLTSVEKLRRRIAGNLAWIRSLRPADDPPPPRSHLSASDQSVTPPDPHPHIVRKFELYSAQIRLEEAVRRELERRGL
jgi:hypothetical protein